MYGVARRGRPNALSLAVRLFLERSTILDWSSAVAIVFGELRADCEASVINLSAFDMMIAAHAMNIDATLVSRNKAFRQKGLVLDVEGWSTTGGHCFVISRSGVRFASSAPSFT